MSRNFLQRKKIKKIAKHRTHYTCKDCGPEKVQGVFWVELNTEKPDMTDWDQNHSSNSFYCPDCHESVEIEEHDVKIYE